MTFVVPYAAARLQLSGGRPIPAARDVGIQQGLRGGLGRMGLNTLNGLGQIYMEMNQLQRAETLIAQAVEMGRTIQAQTPEMAEALELYSIVLRKLSKRSEAENLHSEAARIRAELVLTTRAGP